MYKIIAYDLQDGRILDNLSFTNEVIESEYNHYLDHIKAYSSKKAINVNIKLFYVLTDINGLQLVEHVVICNSCKKDTFSA